LKISTAQYYKNLNELMTNQQAKIAELQAQLATGKKNVTPSTDVKSTTSSIKLSTVISSQEDYIDTLRNINANYIEEESAMSSMSNMIRRIQELCIAGSNGTYSQDDLNMFANEIAGYLDDIRGLANTKDSNGHYIFSGTKTTTLPFVKQNDGSTIYQGNQSEIKTTVEGGYALPLNISGSKLAGSLERKNDAGIVVTKVDMFKVMEDALNAIRSNNLSEIQRGSVELDLVIQNLGSNLVENGLRQKIVSERETIAQDKILVYRNLLSKSQDIDYATAITQLSSDMLALEAAQSTFSKVAQLSLFDFIK
jgi:flagellar hook-associated protein 3 FlgL